MVLVHGLEPPDDAAWDAYVESLATTDKRRVLVVSDGPGPNAAQRQRMVERLGDHETPTAVVSGSLTVRGIVTALSWFGANIRGFSSSELDGALDYLQVPESERPAVLRAALGLRAELAGGSVAEVDSLSLDEVREALGRSFRDYQRRLARAAP